MEPIIHKSGNALIYVGLAGARSLQHLVPECTKVHQILPGVSFFAIGIFKYDTISDLRIGNEHYAWSDLYDVTVQVPVDYFNARKLFYIHRLYNTNREVVQWAKGDYLTKIPSSVYWHEEGDRFHVATTREDGVNEHIELTCRKTGPVPGFLWKVNPFNSLVDAFLMSEFGGLHYCFHGQLAVKKSWWGTGSYSARGLELPDPIASCSIVLEGYDPLKIMPIHKLYHQCDYNHVTDRFRCNS